MKVIVFFLFCFTWAHSQCSSALSRVSINASSVEVDSLKAEKAIDGYSSTRWNSNYSQSQWLTIDLGSVKSIEGVQVDWAAAYATDYDIRYSATGVSGSFQTAFSENSGTGGNDEHSFSAIQARYIGIDLNSGITFSGNFWGYSIKEYRVYANCSGSSSNLASSMASSSSSSLVELSSSSQPLSSSSTNSNKIVLGYVYDGSEPTAGQLQKMTHIAISFLRPSNNLGALTMTGGNNTNVPTLVTNAHQNNTKALISFGGGEFSITSALMGNTNNRTALINNMVDFVKNNNLDGIDIDWEPSFDSDLSIRNNANNTLKSYYSTFVSELKAAMDTEFGANNKILGAAVLNSNGGYFPTDNWWNHMNFVSLMNYDDAVGSSHSTYSAMLSSVSHWVSNGIPKAKLVVGSPFYGRAGWSSALDAATYAEIITEYPSLSKNTNSVSHNFGAGTKTYGFNGVNTVISKANRVLTDNLAGIMFWQLGGDVEVTSSYSLLKAISETVYPSGIPSIGTSSSNSLSSSSSIIISSSSGGVDSSPEVSSSSEQNLSSISSSSGQSSPTLSSSLEGLSQDEISSSQETVSLFAFDVSQVEYSQTSIHFQKRSNGAFSVQIFDFQGREVLNLNKRFLQEEVAFSWGNPLVAGVYFVVIKHENIVRHTQKLLF